MKNISSLQVAKLFDISTDTLQFLEKQDLSIFVFIFKNVPNHRPRLKTKVTFAKYYKNNYTKGSVGENNIFQVLGFIIPLQQLFIASI
ncbi:MAG TPA: hypothetical protein VNW29_07905 [Candidatus Sulfotelmatobacter sp.]|jgi:hypothetical protein|nr:hypothetical protein [Candidatus Sulfotelmatobacter sp.]